jgi:nitrogen regulatory protein PII
MKLTACSLLTIIIEDELETRLVGDLRRLGVRGYTITKARGAGTTSVRDSEWEGENIVIQILASAEKAESILEMLSATYFDRAGVTAYVTPASVVRGQKYLQ